MTSELQEPLSDRLKEQVAVSIRDALGKATNVLSNLHRVQSYLDIICSLPPTRSNDIVKNAVEQVKTARNDAASLLQTVYLTEIGLQSLQDFDKQGSGGMSVSSFMPILGDSINSTVITSSAPINNSSEKAGDSILSLAGNEVMTFSTSDNDGEPSPKKMKLGVTITSCVECSRKFAYHAAGSSTPLCRACRVNTSDTGSSPYIATPPHPSTKPKIMFENPTAAKLLSPSKSSTPKTAKSSSSPRKAGMVPLKCRLCDASFVYRRCLFRHIKENHPGTDKSNLGQYILMGTSFTAGGTEVHMVAGGNEESITSQDMEVDGMTESNSSLHVTIGSEVGGANLTSGDLVDDTPPSNVSTGDQPMGESADDAFKGSDDSTADHNESIGKISDDGKCVEEMVNGEKIFKCLVCNKAFNRPYRIQRHLQVHNPDRPRVQCHICEKTFTRVDTLQTHIRCVHTDERPFACTFEGCNKSFPVQSGLVYHLKSHMDGKPYKCPECPDSFALMSEFKSHITDEHSSTKDVRCSDCFKVFPTRHALDEHRSLEHRLECEICNKTFAKLGYLQAHVEIHNGSSLYNCRFCNAGFDNEYSYKQHVKTHPKYNRVRKTHPCPVCNDTFLDAKELMEHYQTDEHRQNVSSLGLTNATVLHTIEPNLPSDVSALVEEATNQIARRSIEEEQLIQSIAESDAFRVAAAVLSANVEREGGDVGDHSSDSGNE